MDAGQRVVKHRLIADRIAERVNRGVYHGKIPGERALAAEFECNFKTANRAVSALVEDGLLERRRGEGTFVAREAVGERTHLSLAFYKWTPGMKRVVAYAREVGRAIMGFTPHVSVVRSQQGFAACYGERSMMLNLQRLGHRFFNDDSPEGMLSVDKLLIHEYGHEYSDNHLSEDYYRALCKLGAKLAAWKAERGAGWEVSDA